MFPRRGEEEEEDSLFEDEDQEQPEVTTIQKPMRKTPRRQAVHIIDEVLAEEDAFLDEEEFKEPAPKKSRVPMMTAPVKDILASYTPSSTQPLNQIYDKNWKITGQQFVDAMDIDGEPSPALLERHEAEEEVVPSIVVPDSEYKKSLFEKTTPAPTTTAPKRKLETKIIDDPIEGRSKKRGASSASSSSSATATIMSPAMLNERHHDIAAQTSKILNESMRKLLAVDKSVFDNNLEADMHIKIAMEDFTKLFQALDVRIFNPDHVPSTADDGMDAPSIPILYRAYIFKYLRAPVFENHERACCRGENCESHKMFLQYKTSTANNIKAGPQFPLQTQSFALRELLLPAVEEEIVQRLARGENMAEIMRTIKPQVCYLCHLKLVNEWVIMAASKNKPIVAPTVLQPFAIKIGTAGEYNSDALLSCGSNNLYGLVAPFPEFIYDNYVPFMHTVPLDRQRKETRTVLGWAEVNEIICEPSSAMHPRGYPPESSGYAAPSSSSSSSLLFGGGGNSVSPAAPFWRSRYYHDTLRKTAVFGVQANRMTGDTFQTGGATTTRYKERKFTDEEKRNANLFPYFKKHEWLIGNNAFIESTRPLFRAYKPVTGTGTCELPTTVECLRGYFGDEISKVVFTDTLSLCKVSENLEAIRSFSETAKFLMEKKPYWMATEATIKDEYVRSNLFEWISFRLNWAYYKRDVIRRLYDRQLSQVTTNIYLHNNFAMNKQKRMDSTPIDTAFSAEELEEMAKSTPYSHFLQTLEKEMEENNITIMSIAMRSTALPVHTQFYDPYVSRDELSSTMASAPAASGEASHSSDSEGGESSAPTNKKFVANNTTFTYHRYWALYYIRLLEQFIDSHSHLCHAMTRHQDHAFVFKPMAPLPTQSVKELVENYDVPTTFHPFDELYAKWNWTPIQGHQGSRNILAERFPHELIFKYPMVYLYHIMQRRFPTFMIPAAEQEKVREYMLKTAQSVQKGWKENPLLPRDLLEGNTPWTLSETEEPFGPNKRFMWTLFTIIGRLEQLRSEVTEQEKGDEYRQDFYWHQIQVRLTGYLPIVRWMLNELMIEDPKQPDIFDSRVPEAMEYFQCDDMDFDGELDMPRLSVLLHLLNYWYNTGPYSKKNPILAALQKGIPFRSTARVLSNHFLNETKYNYHFISLTMMFTMVTTLGLFRRMKGAPPMYRPNFGTMVKIDFALLQTPKQLFNFIHVTKSKIIIYMSREVLVHAMAKAPHYRDHQLLNWSVLEKHTWEVCNDIRKYLRNYKFWLKAPFNVSRINLEDSIQTNHEQHYDLFLFPQQDFLHTIMHVFYSQHIKHLDKIIILQTQMKHLVRDLNNATPEAGHEELELKLRHTQAQLQLITYELDEPTRNIIWQTMIGKRNDIKLWSFIRQFLGDEDLILFHRLHEEYAHFTPKKKMELTVSQFSLRAFTMIYYLLQLQVQLKTYHLMALPQEMTREIHLAMRQRHHLFDTQPMLSSVYHAHVTLCCEKLATMHDTGSYGNSLIMYSRRGNYFACCRKRMKKAGYTAAGNTNASGQDGKKGGHSVSKSNDDDKDDDDEEDGEEEEEEEQNPEEEDAEGEEPTGGGGGEDQDEKRILVKIQKRKEKLADITKSTQKILDRIRKKQSMSNLIDKTRIGKDVSMDDYPTMSFKERRKIVCRLDMDTKPLECKNNPSVATFNLQGRSLVIGSEYAKMTTYQHCPKCGDLHTYSLKHYNNGQGYMCANCVQKYWVPSLEMQRHMFCVYCGRQHFKDVKQGLTMMPTIDVGDPTNPVKFFNYCNTDRPKYKYDYMFDRHNKNNTIHMLFLDTYLNRHHNMLRQDCMAYFPFQNTVQENAEHIDIKYNQFSWPLYGKRAHQIPQLIDVWWPSGSKL